MASFFDTINDAIKETSSKGGNIADTGEATESETAAEETAEAESESETATEESAETESGEKNEDPVKKDEVPDKDKLTEWHRKLQRRESKINNKSAELTRQQEAVKAEIAMMRQQFEAERKAWQDEVRRLKTAPIDEQRRILSSHVGLDPDEFYRALSKAAIGAPPSEEERLASLEAELKRHRDEIAQREEQARLQEEARRVDAQVHWHLRRETESDPELKEYAGLVPGGADQVAQELLDIGYAMVKNGVRMPPETAPRLIIAEAKNFLRSPAGVEYLNSLRPTPPPTPLQKPVAGVRKAPGKTISARDISAPAGKTEPLTGQELTKYLSDNLDTDSFLNSLGFAQ